MISTAAVIMFIVFAACTLALLAVALAARDFVTRPITALDRRLGLDPQCEEDAIELIATPPSGGSIDKSFYRLIEESGTRHTVASALVLVAGAAVIGCAAPLLLLDNLLAAAGGLVIAATLPLAWWSTWRWWRLKAMRKYLPQTLDLVADAVRGGRNLEQAAEMAAVETPGPLGREFAHAAAQLKLGQTPNAVLEGMVRRVPLPEFRIFAAAVVVHRRAGGNLAELTQRLARTARDRHEFFGHLSAVTAGSRMSAIGLVIGSGVGVAALAALQPEYLRMFVTHPWGPTLLVVAASLQLLGIVWVYRILRVNY